MGTEGLRIEEEGPRVLHKSSILNPQFRAARCKGFTFDVRLTFRGERRRDAAASAAGTAALRCAKPKAR
jgi:hypothetical protein